MHKKPLCCFYTIVSFYQQISKFASGVWERGKNLGRGNLIGMVFKLGGLNRENRPFFVSGKIA
jgi:hypothetical protein